MSTSTTPTKAFSSRLLGLIKHPKFFWWCGHLLLLVQSFRYYLAYAYGNSDTAASAYAWAYSGVLLSYAIVLFRTLNWPSLTKWREDLVLLTRIDNVQYTMLALVWYFSEPVAISFPPYIIFSSFHALNYITGTLIPALATPSYMPPPTNSSRPTAQSPFTLRFAKKMDVHVRRFYALAIKFTVFWEVVIIPVWLIVCSITFRIRLTLPLAFASFLFQRYTSCSLTREKFRLLRLFFDRTLLQGRAPPLVSKVYMWIRDKLCRLGIIAETSMRIHGPAR